MPILKGNFNWIKRSNSLMQLSGVDSRYIDIAKQAPKNFFKAWKKQAAFQSPRIYEPTVFSEAVA